MINFYHRFVINLTLNEYLKNVRTASKKIVWTDEAKVAFHKSKELLAQFTLLV